MKMNTIYLYDEDTLEEAIDEILEGYGDSYGAELTEYMYATIFNSDMTDMDVAIVSDNIQDVKNITDDDFMYWLDNEDGEDYYGLTVVDDESETLIHIKDAVLFSEPLEDIIDTYGVSTVSEALQYAKRDRDIWYIPEDVLGKGVLLEDVASTHFRF